MILSFTPSTEAILGREIQKNARETYFGGKMTGPRRIHRQRTKGWRAPDGAVNVTRPGKFGNPFTIAAVSAWFPKLTKLQAQAKAVELFDKWLDGDDGYLSQDAGAQVIIDGLPELLGKNLMCWCKEGEPCHGDVLLRRANAAETQERT